jgi:serine/threonine protein kinase
MVMEYCEGKSLDLLINKRIHSGKWFNLFEFLKIFKDIVNGYYPLNKVMIMHEDLKPENILIKGKNFKIGDFGLSFLMKSEKGFSRGGTTSYNGI